MPQFVHVSDTCAMISLSAGRTGICFTVDDDNGICVSVIFPCYKDSLFISHFLKEGLGDLFSYGKSLCTPTKGGLMRRISYDVYLSTGIPASFQSARSVW
jgi:hypothetical protein